MFLTAWIAIEAIQRFMNPVPVDGTTIFKIGSAGLLVNLIVFALLRRSDEHDMNISAATLHVLSDLLGSVAAIVAGIVIVYTGWTPIDPLLSLFVCLLIVRGAWALIRRSTHILMEGSPDDLDVAELRRTLEQRIPAIRDVHHVHTWLVGPQDILLTMHASVTINADHSNVLREAKTVLAERYGIKHATIQIEADDCVDQDCAEK
jgi:cobalt-zinc-cadmium efflux system protein